MSVLRAWSLGGPSRGRGCHLEQADLAEQPIVRRVTAVTGAARVAPSTPNRRVPAVVTSQDSQWVQPQGPAEGHRLQQVLEGVVGQQG